MTSLLELALLLFALRRQAFLDYHHALIIITHSLAAYFHHDNP